MTKSLATEEDTFLRLKREPFRKVFVECIKGVALGDDVIHKNWRLIENSGWVVSEFRDRMHNEILARRLELAVAIINDSDWQREYLRSGPI